MGNDMKKSSRLNGGVDESGVLDDTCDRVTQRGAPLASLWQTPLEVTVQLIHPCKWLTGPSWAFPQSLSQKAGMEMF